MSRDVCARHATGGEKFAAVCPACFDETVKDLLAERAAHAETKAQLNRERKYVDEMSGTIIRQIEASFTAGQRLGEVEARAIIAESQLTRLTAVVEAARAFLDRPLTQRCAIPECVHEECEHDLAAFRRAAAAEALEEAAKDADASLEDPESTEQVAGWLRRRAQARRTC